jgi:ribosomal protein L11 methyltransferase
MGASDIVAVEGDPLAVEAMEENVGRNGVAGAVTIDTTWADNAFLASLAPRDGVVANLESGILRPLLPGFASVLPADGWLILSGILAEEWPGVRDDTIRAGFRFVEVDEDGEWRSGLFRRTSP